MKIWSLLFAYLMFLALFGVPVAQTCFQDDFSIVLQGLEENDLEEGEDTTLEDLEENLFNSRQTSYLSIFVEQKIKAHLMISDYFTYAQELGVETPPPRFT